MFPFLASSDFTRADAARMRRIERKIDMVMKHLGIAADADATDPGQLPAEVRRLADEGRKIEAIKAHRQAFGSGLREAKEAVEAYMGR